MLKSGQEIELGVEKAAAGGRMIARHDGQVVLVAATLPAPNLRALLKDYEAEEEASEEPAVQRPQEGDCSAPAVEQANQADPTPQADRATSPAASACDTKMSEAWNDLRTAPPTVQLPAKRAEGARSQTHHAPPLTRQDRRARQKLLEQKLKGARQAG